MQFPPHVTVQVPVHHFTHAPPHVTVQVPEQLVQLVCEPNASAALRMLGVLASNTAPKTGNVLLATFLKKSLLPWSSFCSSFFIFFVVRLYPIELIGFDWFSLN